MTVDEITLKYLVSGHTYMASDSAHGRIEKEMRSMKTVYDYKDFQTCVVKARCQILEMDVQNFNDWKSGVTQYQLKKLGEARPYIENIVYVRFQKGTNLMRYKEDLYEEETSVSIIGSSVKIEDLKNSGRKREARGIAPGKKKQIIEKLVCLMPENRQYFWETLKTNQSANDLLTDKKF